MGSAQSHEERPAVSVVVPAYNAGLTIGRALQSIMDQTYRTITEVIVVDDGSTDDTAAIVSERFPQVQLVRQANAGAGRARNRGAEIATGDYVAFLDADDEWFPFKTDVQIDVAARFPGAGAIGSNLLWVPEGTSVLPRWKEHRPAAVSVRCASFARSLRTLGVCAVQSMVIRRDVFLAVGGFGDYRVGEDLDFGLRLQNLGHRAFIVEEPLMVSYRRSHSTSGPVTSRMEYARNTVLIMRSLDPTSDACRIMAPQAFARAFRLHCRRTALWAIRHGYLRLAMDILSEPPSAPTGVVDAALRSVAAMIGRAIGPAEARRPGDPPRCGGR